MATLPHIGRPWRLWVIDKLLLGQRPSDYVRGLVTPFNGVVLLILCVGVPVTFIRFTQGLGATTNLTNTFPWGIWIGFDVLCGVALAAGGFVLAAAVHLFGLRDYHPLVRPAILTGFLGYFFVVVGLCFDLGRPWRLPYPMFVSYGVTSVMFEVGWCVALYLTVLFLECLPPVFEWLNALRLRRYAVAITTLTAVLGLTLSTLHQSSLGGLFLIAPTKLHPLWYSHLIPVYFFVSAVSAGLAMVVFESTLSHRIFPKQTSHVGHAAMDRLILGLGKAASVVLFAYFGLKVIGLAEGQHWDLLLTGWGAWFLLELVGFVALPCVMFAVAVRRSDARWVRGASVVTILGVILNRLNVSVIAFQWNLPDRYVPSWMEVVVSLTLVSVGLVAFRWIVNRLPVLYDHPEFEAVD